MIDASTHKDTFILFMGPLGAGKSSILESYCSKKPTDSSEIRIISPDTIKEGLPKYRDLLARGVEDASVQVHEESIRHATTEFNAYLESSPIPGKRRILIFDGTGSWMPFCEELLTSAKKAGFIAKAFFVHARLDTCKERALKRFLETGRAAPEHIIEKAYHAAHANFTRLRGILHGWKVFDNNQPLEDSVTPVAGRRFKKIDPSMSPILPPPFTPYIGEDGEKLIEAQWAEHERTTPRSISSESVASSSSDTP